MKVMITIVPTGNTVKTYNYETTILPATISESADPRGLIQDQGLSLLQGAILIADANGDLR